MKKIILIPLILALTACTPVVDDKYYVPKFERDHEECFRSSKYGCQEGKQLRVEVPECWRLIIDEGMNSGDVCVPKDVWEKTQVGQEWTDETYAI